jgi:hypothetical protein
MLESIYNSFKTPSMPNDSKDYDLASWIPACTSGSWAMRLPTLNLIRFAL